MIIINLNISKAVQGCLSASCPGMHLVLSKGKMTLFRSDVLKGRRGRRPWISWLIFRSFLDLLAAWQGLAGFWGAQEKPSALSYLRICKFFCQKRSVLQLRILTFVKLGLQMVPNCQIHQIRSDQTRSDHFVFNLAFLFKMVCKKKAFSAEKNSFLFSF